MSFGSPTAPPAEPPVDVSTRAILQRPKKRTSKPTTGTTSNTETAPKFTFGSIALPISPVAQLKDTNRQLANDIAFHSKANRELYEGNVKLYEENANLRRFAEDRIHAVEAQGKRIQDQDEVMKKNEVTIKDLHKSAEDRIHAMEAQGKKIQDQDEVIKKNEEIIKDLQAKNQKLQGTADVHQTEQGQADGLMAEFQGKLAAKDEELKETKQNFRTAESQRKEAEKTIDRQNTKISAQDATLNKRKEKIDELKEEIKGFKVHIKELKQEQAEVEKQLKDTRTEGQGNLSKQIQQLKAAHEKELQDMDQKRAWEAQAASQEFLLLQQANHGFGGEIDKLQRVIDQHTETIKDLQRERDTDKEAKHSLEADNDNLKRRVRELTETKEELTETNDKLRRDVDTYKSQVEAKDKLIDEKRIMEPAMKNQAVCHSNGGQVQTANDSSTFPTPASLNFTPGNQPSDDLGQFSPPLPSDDSPRPHENEAQYSPSVSSHDDDVHETNQSSTFSMSKPITIVNMEPSPATPNSNFVGLGITATQTAAKPDDPPQCRSPSEATLASGINIKPKVIDFGISKPSTMNDIGPENTPKEPALSISQPLATVNFEPKAPRLGMSKPLTIIDIEPQDAPIGPALSTEKPATTISIAPKVPTFGISKPMTTIDFKPVDAPVPEVPNLRISKPVTTIDIKPVDMPMVPVSTKPIEGGPGRKTPLMWRLLWYLLLLLALVILLVAASYGESARRERTMWLAANDFSRRAVISVRAGGGTGTSVPAWLWNDQLLDHSSLYYG